MQPQPVEQAGMGLGERDLRWTHRPAARIRGVGTGGWLIRIGKHNATQLAIGEKLDLTQSTTDDGKALAGTCADENEVHPLGSRIPGRLGCGLSRKDRRVRVR